VSAEAFPIPPVRGLAVVRAIGLGALMVLCGAVPPEAGDLEPADSGAVLTSRHAVYATGEPVDLTLWVNAAPGPVRLGLEVRGSQGRSVPERDGGAPAYAAEVLGAAAPGVNTLATVPDLRKWFDLDVPGDYTLTIVPAPGDPGPAVRSEPLGLSVRDGVKSDPIPLDQVWALDMPGTRPMNRTQTGDPPAYVAPEGRLADEIRAALSSGKSGARFDPGPGFAVHGHGLAALREAHAVLVGGRLRQTSFRAGEPVSLVFFAREFNYYVHLAGVERCGPDVQITYRFVPHRTKELSSHFALIPLSAGTALPTRVEVKPVIDSGTVGLDWGSWPRRIVCGSFRLDGAAGG
jgi:hypothetical protein